MPGQASEGRPCATGLRTEYVDYPLGIDVAVPRFSWRMSTTHRDAWQSAYQVVAASSETNLERGHFDVWDSGRVESDRCFEVPYGGRPLVSGERIYWQVRLWDEHGRACSPSAPSWFEMGLLDPVDWRGKWLVAEDPTEAADRAAGLHWIWSDYGLDGRPVKFRFCFVVPSAPARAELLLSAKDKLLGVWANGKPVALPAQVCWGTMCRLPLALKQGENVLCVEASALTEDFLPPDGGAVAALLHIVGTDGSVTRLTTGPKWRVFNGDAKDWEKPSFDDGKWVAAVSSKAKTTCEPWPTQPARLMRRAFQIGKPIARARLYATALGVYEAFLNGVKIGDARLAPEITTAADHILYQTYDVTSMLRAGRNALGAHIGDGWYAGAFAWRSERYALGDGPKRFLAQLVIDYEDGSSEIVATDSSWRTDRSPVVSSDIYNGETYDGRLEQNGWATADFDDSDWRNAVVGTKPDTRLISQISPPIRATKTVDAVSIHEVAPGVSVFDFGQNFSGWCRLHAKGGAGSKVELRYGELLRPDGRVDQSNLRDAAATDSYVLRGEADGEVFEPHFTYHGFRYVECRGTGRVEGVVAHSALPDTGTIKIGNAQIQRFSENTLWSQRSNFFGVPTDCPQRDERMGWMGDIQVFLDAAAFNMDVDAFIRRFLLEARAGQSPDGAYPVVTPQPRSFPHMLTAGWSEAGIILPWVLFERYGDTRVIDENWEAMSRWMYFLEEANPDGLWRNRRGLDLGDWLSVDAVRPADETTPRMLAATAFWAYAAELMAKMAVATGRDTEAKSYAERHRAIIEPFRAAFVRPDGAVGNGSQAGYVLALKFGLVPKELRTAAASHLAAEIAGRGMKLSTGFLGTPYLLDVLCEYGQTETAIVLLLQTDYPSWGYMIRKGATTIWERWNSDVGDLAMNSYNHYAFGAVMGFVYRRLAGIAPVAPGFRRIAVNPLCDPRIGPVEAEYHSCLGRIATKVEGDAMGLARLTLTVPANAAAEVHLPRGRAWREGGKALEGRAGIRSVTEGRDEIVLETGSGDYIFET